MEELGFPVPGIIHERAARRLGFMTCKLGVGLPTITPDWLRTGKWCLIQ